MLINFTLENYRSIKEPVTLSMKRVKNLREQFRDKTNLIPIQKNVELLKSVVIYGANGSGKTNILRGFNLFKRLVRGKAATHEGDLIPVDSFKFSEETCEQPSVFETNLFLDDSFYRYRCSVSRNKVYDECLWKNDKPIFERSEGNFSLPGISMKKELVSDVVKLTRDNALFLSVCSQFRLPIVNAVASFFAKSNVIAGLCEMCYKSASFGFLEEDHFRAEILRFLSDLGTGISDIELKKVPQESDGLKHKHRFVTTYHQVGRQSYSLPLEEESEGTQKIVCLSANIINALNHGRLLVVDEFDARFHPNLVEYFVRLFNSPRNSKGAQLIISAHDASVLRHDILRRDQILFADKRHETNATILTPLSSFDVRQDSSYMKDYLNGKYGAVPEIASVSMRGETNE